MREEKREGRRLGEERLREPLLSGFLASVWGYAWIPWAYLVRRYEIGRARKRQRSRRGMCITRVNIASIF